MKANELPNQQVNLTTDIPQHIVSIAFVKKIPMVYLEEPIDLGKLWLFISENSDTPPLDGVKLLTMSSLFSQNLAYMVESHLAKLIALGVISSQFNGIYTAYTANNLAKVLSDLTEHTSQTQELS